MKFFMMWFDDGLGGGSRQWSPLHESGVLHNTYNRVRVKYVPRVNIVSGTGTVSEMRSLLIRLLSAAGSRRNLALEYCYHRTNCR